MPKIYPSNFLKILTILTAVVIVSDSLAGSTQNQRSVAVDWPHLREAEDAWLQNALIQKRDQLKLLEQCENKKLMIALVDLACCINRPPLPESGCSQSSQWPTNGEPSHTERTRPGGQYPAACAG